MSDDKKIALTITANTRQLRRDMRQAGKYVSNFERQVSGMANKLRAARMRFQQSGIFARGGGALKTAAGFAGVFGFQQLIQGAKEANAELTDIAITGNLTEKQLSKLKKTIFDISNATGKSKKELRSFVATVTTMTGDAKGASEALAGISDVMVATGASGEALAGTYVKLTTSMGLMPKQARAAFNILRSQEKLGSVTLQNISTNFGKIVGAAGVYGDEAKGLKGVRTLGGLYQIAQRGYSVGQEGEAATSVGAFLSFMARRSKQVKKEFGVSIFDKAGNARDLPTVFEELGQAFNAKRETFRTKGQLIFGRAGIRTAQQLAAAARAPGGFAGQMGAFSSANSLLRTAGQTDVLTSDKNRRMESDAAKFERQMTRLQNIFMKHMGPAFKKIADLLTSWGPQIEKTIKFILDNSETLLKLWLGYKGLAFFRSLAAPAMGAGGVGGAGGVAVGVGGVAVGAGGVAVGAGGVAARQLPINKALAAKYAKFKARQGMINSVGSGLLSAVPMIPAAIDAGIKLGEYLAGTNQKEVIKDRVSTVESIERAKIKYRLYGKGKIGGEEGKKYAELGGSYMRSFYLGRGAKMQEKMYSFLRNTDTGKGDEYEFNAASLEKLTPEQRKNALAKLTGMKTTIMKETRRGMEAAGMAPEGSILAPSKAQFDRMAYQANPVLKDLSAAIWALESVVAKDDTLPIHNMETLPLGASSGDVIKHYQKYGPKGLMALRESLGAQKSALRIGAKRELIAQGIEPTEENLAKSSPMYDKADQLLKMVNELIGAVIKGQKLTVTMPAGSTPAQRLEKNNKPNKAAENG